MCTVELPQRHSGSTCINLLSIKSQNGRLQKYFMQKAMPLAENYVPQKSELCFCQKLFQVIGFMVQNLCHYSKSHSICPSETRTNFMNRIPKLMIQKCNPLPPHSALFLSFPHSGWSIFHVIDLVLLSAYDLLRTTIIATNSRYGKKPPPKSTQKHRGFFPFSFRSQILLKGTRWLRVALYWAFLGYDKRLM